MTVKNRLRQWTLGLRQFALGLAACFILAVQSATVLGQYGLDDALIEHDLQFFAPVDFDFDNRPIRKDHGWTFRYDKLSWARTGNRVTVGNPNVQILSEAIFPGNADADQGVPPPQYQIINGLQNVPLTDGFSWGERYELGRLDNGSGWMIGILDGPEVNTSMTFGAGPEAFGFGSLSVNFATPPGYLLGLRDYQIQTSNGADFVIGQNPVNNGPGQPGIGQVPSDGLVDDINGDALPVFYFFGIDIDGDGEISDEEVRGNGVDFGDLHLFNLTFDQATVRNTTETQGVEIMKTFRLSNGHRLEKKRNQHFDIGYGVRFLRLRDQFSFSGTSPLMATMQFATEAENQLVGPQIRARWANQRGRWSWDLDSRLMLAYNTVEANQTGSFGLDNTDEFGFVVNPGLAPGAVNRPLIAQPNVFSSGRRDNEFSPTIEVRAETSYQITGAIAVRLGYTGIFVDNISRGAAITNYSLPDFGFLEGGQQEIFINGVNFGFDVIY